MKWSIPAKTFFLGEYAAIAGAPAIILTTSPCFEVTLVDELGLQGIHPDSPAGRLWAQHDHMDNGLLWQDPYHGRGGLGASSAQFLGAWFASQYLQAVRRSECNEGSPELREISRGARDDGKKQEDMLNAYYQCAWQGIGVRPSGYDIVAQSLHGCVYIHRQQALCQTYDWPFKDLAFILVHTGQKLATHQHLQTMNMVSEIGQLATIVESAKSAFATADSSRVIDAVNVYHKRLLQLGLVAGHSMKQIELLQKNIDILAIKGCGAMGADVLLLLVPQNRCIEHSEHLSVSGFDILATSEDLLITAVPFK